jgi:putative ABC transport system permease protein
VAKLPGVAGASALVTSKAYIEAPVDTNQDEDGLAVQGVTAGGIDRVRPFALTQGSLAGLTGNTVALPKDRADRIGVHAGDVITMRLGDGTMLKPTVIATFTADPAFATALLPVATLAPHTTGGIATQILVRAAPGRTPAELSATLAGLAKQRPGLAVLDRDALTAAFVDKERSNAWVNYLVVGMILIYAGISVVNTLVMATAHRRREFVLQRLIGSTKGQVLRMTTVEALMVAVIGCGLGTIVAAAMLLPFSAAVSDGVLPSGPLWILLAVLGLAAVLTVLATVVPAWLTIRGRTSMGALSLE